MFSVARKLFPWIGWAVLLMPAMSATKNAASATPNPNGDISLPDLSTIKIPGEVVHSAAVVVNWVMTSGPWGWSALYIVACYVGWFIIAPNTYKALTDSMDSSDRRAGMLLGTVFAPLAFPVALTYTRAIKHNTPPVPTTTAKV